MNLEARWWREEAAAQSPVVRCGLCPHACLIHEGKAGYCGARFCTEGRLSSPFLGRFSSLAVDPVEKKPLYHWRPGTRILSLGSLGCTMRCPFCQNHAIAQPSSRNASRYPLKKMTPEALLAALKEHGLDSVAYTYNEPALQGEYILAAAAVLKPAGVATVLVSNGMYTEAFLRDILPVVDAANIDLKSFNPESYAAMGGDFTTVRQTITAFVSAGIHVEVTTLVVPGISDSPEEFAAQTEWLAELSPDIPLHISRYRPAHKYNAPATDIELLQRFAAMAQLRLRRVHVGNVPYLRM